MHGALPQNEWFQKIFCSPRSFRAGAHSHFCSATAKGEESQLFNRSFSKAASPLSNIHIYHLRFRRRHHLSYESSSMLNIGVWEIRATLGLTTRKPMHPAVPISILEPLSWALVPRFAADVLGLRVIPTVLGAIRSSTYVRQKGSSVLRYLITNRASPLPE